MIRRYDLARSDNIPYAGRKAYACSGSGYISILTGFPVSSATITWSSLPTYDAPYEMSSSSTSSSSSSSVDSSSSSSSSFSSSSESSESSESSFSSSSSSSLDSSSSSSSSSGWALQVTGNITPDATGNYEQKGSHDGYPTYYRDDGAYWISFNILGGLNIWRIAQVAQPWLTWHKTFVGSYDVMGAYSVTSGTTGIAYVGVEESSSSSSSSLDSSSSSSLDSSSSSSSNSSSSNSSSSSTSNSSSSSTTSNEYPGPFDKPRIYISDYLSNGFRVRYENIPEEVGFVEFAYVAF